MNVKFLTKVSVLLLFLLVKLSIIYAQNSKIQPIPNIVSWEDNSNLILSQVEDKKQVYYRFNINKQLKEKIDLPVSPVATPSVSIKNGDIYFKSAQGEEKRLTSTKSEEKNPILSPNFKLVAFTRDNNLFTIDVDSGSEHQLTYDGTDVIMNGYASWVYYEEIFGRAGNYRAFWWSPDSELLTFYRFDDSVIPMFPIYDSKGKHGSITETRYPKAGDKNPEVRLGFVGSKGGDILWADFDPLEDQYFGTPFWNIDGSKLMVQWMDRDQSNLTLYAVDRNTGSKESIYKEKQDTWIDWITDIKFGDNGFYFVRDFSLWQQIYYQSFDGKEFRQITTGDNWGVNILSLDEKKREIIFSARRDVSIRNDIYRVNWSKSSSKIEKLSVGDYNHMNVMISPDGKNIVSMVSNSSVPTKINLLWASKGSAVKKGSYTTLFNSAKEDFSVEQYNAPKMITLTTPEGFELPGNILYPENFDSTKKYPVIFYIYGGPNSTYVMDTWRGVPDIRRELSKMGVIQVSVDNRASGHFGKRGINYIHRNLGHYELLDYIEWAKYFSSLPYVNSEKIGITGFSYGGTMTALALTDGAEYFKYGIAGAGVYDWQLYDTHYTERYMDRPDNNPDGYNGSAVINKVKKYRDDLGSRLYLTHGTADDNVHMQNTIQLIDALQKENKLFDLMLYPGAFHGYRGYHGSHSHKATIEFWQKWLLN